MAVLLPMHPLFPYTTLFRSVVVSSTSAHEYVLTRAQVERTLRGRRGRPLFLIDLAVPRDLDPEINDLDGRSEEHTSELQSRLHLVCRLLLEKKKKNTKNKPN